MKDQDSSSDGIQSGGLRNASIVADASRAPAADAPKGASRAAVALLEDFGRVLGLPSLHFGEDDCCWLNIGEEHITCIATFGDTGFLRLHGEVAELPAERDAPDVSGYFFRLLTRNGFAVKRGDALPLAIDPRRNALVLTSTVPISATGQQLYDAMELLTEQLMALKQNPPPLDGGTQGGKPARADDDDKPENNAAAGVRSPAFVHGDFTHATQLTVAPPDASGELMWRV